MRARQTAVSGAVVLENLLEELRGVRPDLREVGGVLATPKATEIMRRTRTAPTDLVARYQNDRSEVARTEPIGYRLFSETKPDSQTCVHVAFDPELGEVVIYEEW